MADIKLTLGNEPAPAAPNPTAAATATAEAPIEEIKEEVQEEVKKQTFSPEEQAQIDEFAKKIDITNSSLVFQYGAGTQQNIASFSDTALNNVRSKDLGEVGDMIAGLVTELRSFNVDSDEKKGLFSFLRQKVDKVQLLKNRYDDVEVNVNKLVNELENHQVQLLKDIATMDQLYDMNLTYFKELSMYIAAGNEALEAFRSGPLAEARAKAQQSGLPEDAQYASDLAAKAERFEKKLYDLELTRNVAIQMAPQIRLLQNNDSLLVERIQSTLSNTLPLWKSQMVLALGLHHSQQALKAQTAVTDMTNELLRKNAQALKMGTVETAREAERGIIDIETLVETSQSLIDTINEVMQIQQEGRTKRIEAEKTLYQMETELKKKLIQTNL